MSERWKEPLFLTGGRAHGSVTISARQGIRIALRLLWASLRAWRADSLVDFTFWEDA